MFKLACCCGAALFLVQISCGERQPPALDGAVDGRAQPQDSSHGQEGAVQRDQLTPSDTAPGFALFSMFQIKKFYANCMPSVPADPISLSGHVELLNNGTSAVGPIQFSGGTIALAAGTVVATFDVKPIASYVIKPGEGLSPQVEKVPGSLKATSACGLCGKAARVSLAFSGAGIPAGTKVTSSEISLSCAY